MVHFSVTNDTVPPVYQTPPRSTVRGSPLNRSQVRVHASVFSVAHQNLIRSILEVIRNALTSYFATRYN